MSSSESSPWSQWPSLLLPRPNLRHFWQKPHSKSSSALSLASGTTLYSNSTLKDLRRPPSFRSLSAVYTLSGKSTNVTPQALEQRTRVDDAPPQLKPLIFSKEPLVDLMRPPYRPRSPSLPTTSINPTKRIPSIRITTFGA